MGFEWVDRFDDDNINHDNRNDDVGIIIPGAVAASPDARIQQVINLMEEDDDLEEEEGMTEKDNGESKYSNEVVDHWTENALRIQSDLNRIARWIQSKQHEYVGLDMPDEEASLIQSTVTTFAATTASELETLRKLIPVGGTVAGHRNGIVQILLNQLQEEITRPFGILQKQRTRISVKLWQNPWQCQLAAPPSAKASSSSTSRVIQLFDDEEGEDEPATATKEKRFLPRSPLPRPDLDFLDKYERDPLQEGPLPSRPDFLDRLAHVKQTQAAVDDDDDDDESASGTAPKPLPILPPMPKIQTTPNLTPVLPYQEEQQQQQDELQQEAALLQVSIVQSDLDSVQKMEQRMVEITTLIGQFSNLVSEQQEEIFDIARHAQETKKNMTKGQENLVDATERTKRSKHYLAWTIFGLSLMLLFFHTLRN